jgi:plastocyanin
LLTGWTKLGSLAAGLMLALGVPVAAHAATKQVFMGTPPSVQKTFNQTYGIDVNDFFPHAITIHVGDSVKFAPVGFHTLDIPAKPASALPLFLPTGQKVAGANDAAGNPFWFNGLDQLGFNPALGDPSKALYGKTVTYNGKSRVESGLPLGAKLKPVTVKFTKKGTFTYLCDVHPGMKGQVHVVAKTATAPSTKSDAKVVAKMIARDLAAGKPLAKKTIPAGVVDVGEAGPFGIEYFGFLPGKLTVKAGTTVKFQMTSGSFETHTATAGPGNAETEPDSYLGKLAKSLEAPVPDPAGLYPSDAPGTPASLTPQLHGNAFWNSGALDNIAGTPPPANNSVRFDAPGTYEFYCLVHPFMHGTVTVTS